MLRLGETAREVVVIDNSASDKDLETLTNKGVAGIRFYMFPGGALPWSILETMAPRVHNFGWHIQLQLDGKELPNHIELIRRLSCPVLIDHVGNFFEPVSPVSKIFQMMRDLVENGAWVKLSAAYKTSRIGPPNFEDTGALAKAFIALAPERML